MYDLTTAVMNELDQELARRPEARQLELEQAALTDCEDVVYGRAWSGEVPPTSCLDRLNRHMFSYEDWCDCCQARWQAAIAALD